MQVSIMQAPSVLEAQSSDLHRIAFLQGIHKVSAGTPISTSKSSCLPWRIKN